MIANMVEPEWGKIAIHEKGNLPRVKSTEHILFRAHANESTTRQTNKQRHTDQTDAIFRQAPSSNK